MNINPIINGNYTKNNDFKSNNFTSNFINRHNKFERTPQCDSVSFNGQIPIEIAKIVDNKNTANGLKFADKLMMEIYNSGVSSLQTLEKVIHTQYPEVAVKHMRDLAQDIPNAGLYKAYSFSNLDESFNRFNHQMYVDLPKNMQEMPKFIFDASHEYTHLSQDLNGTEDIDILRQASKGNIAVAKTLKSIQESTFNVFNTNIPQYMSLMKKQEGNNIINSELKSIVRQYLAPITADKDKTRMNHLLSAYSNIDDLIFDVKKYCSLKSKQEKEAYATEYALVQGLVLPNSGTCEQVVEFFSKLEDTFSAK